MNASTRFLVIGLSLLSLGGCGGDWLDAIDESLGRNPDHYKPKVVGERVPVLSQNSELMADPTLANDPISLPSLPVNAAWPQAGGTASNVAGNLALPTQISERNSTSVGDGEDFAEGQQPPPVLGDGMVFAMDGSGAISAHAAMDIDDTRWSSDVLELPRESLGGGVAFIRGRVIGVNGAGRVVALHAKAGEELWRFEVGAPVRQPPRVAGNMVFIQTADNQEFALSVINGELIWRHNGATETASLLTPTMPALAENFLIVPYRTGDIIALDIAKGDEVWGLSLAQSLRQGSLGDFPGFAGNPVVDGNILYVATQAGMLAALETQRGGRLWDIPFHAAGGPWVAGDYLFILTVDDKLACVQRADGRIRWLAELPRFVNEETKTRPYEWVGPVMAGGKLWLVSAREKMLRIDAQTGAVEASMDIPRGVRHAPVVANQRLYLLDEDATLHVYD